MTMTTVDYKSPQVHKALLELYSKFRKVSSGYCWNKGNEIPETVWDQWKEFKVAMKMASRYSLELRPVSSYIDHCFRKKPFTDPERCQDALDEAKLKVEDFNITQIWEEA